MSIHLQLSEKEKFNLRILTEGIENISLKDLLYAVDKGLDIGCKKSERLEFAKNFYEKQQNIIIILSVSLFLIASLLTGYNKLQTTYYIISTLQFFIVFGVFYYFKEKRYNQFIDYYDRHFIANQDNFYNYFNFH